ncbi:flagellar biosynthesis protein FlgE [Massilia sp. Root133]|uniref:Flagellar hook protein FlgE n=1 Tax=Massilia cellulosiltytica TaxID=2683234 RepID=A0A7X3K8R8_9BURK|nr:MULTISPECIES: flagellar hook-basal body complex protein [Telluria group]KQY19029.1 flagellar biosynthesis protein FlgE [Massilia sp. Root133]KQZ53421.1 flagellar biosynthesis protein FlgE [Massilia sp. Root1485]MVW61595.1 flagellar hook-basal body complex protein [Telluria cellulosilytica]
MSFDIALSGIQAINEQLNTVSNNIANAATYGFKGSRANFASVMAGSRPNGVEIGSVTQNISTNGSTQTTGRGLDAAIDGRGFFVSVNAQGTTQYSRVGIFSTDSTGMLIDSNGNKVQGYGPSKNGTLGAMGDVQIPTGQIPAVATTGIAYTGNLSADWTVPTVTPFDPTKNTSYNMVKQSIVYDSLGTQHTLSQYFVKKDANTVNAFYSLDGATPGTTPAVLTFDATGALKTTTGNSVAITAAGGAAAGNVTIDYTGTTRFAGEATTTTNRSNGYASGTFVGVEMAADGSLVAKYSNDQSQVVGTVAVATFANEGALSSISDTSWVANADSGAALYSSPGVGLAGKLATGALEGSNVDITSELVGLMTSQRNYQANSKVLTTENQMMQALMQAL